MPWRLSLLLICGCLPAWAARSPEERPPAWAGRLDVMDWAATQSFMNGQAKAADRKSVRRVLGMGGEADPWRAGRTDRGVKAQYAYRIAFTKPIALGTAMIQGAALSYLKPDAPYPGEPDNPAHWETPTPRSRQANPIVYTLPTGVKTRAVLCRQSRPGGGRSELQQCWLLAPRLHNITPDALANAQSEYTHYPAMAPPRTYAAKRIVSGKGGWINTGANKNGFVTRPPITDLNPTWFALSWREPQSIRAVAIRGSVADIRLYSFVGPAGINPAVGTKAEWKWQRRVVRWRHNELLWFWLEKPATTRGLKLLIRQATGEEPAIAKVSAVQVLRELGDEMPDNDVAEAARQPPFQVAYRLPADGYFTMVVDDKAGERVRNLVANTWRQQGSNAEPWDLKDEDGNFVAPGAYRFKAIFHPPLKLLYEMTAYPNVTTHFPDRAAWLTERGGPDGWMADHSPPKAVAVSGDRVVLGSPIAESGVSFIVCDADGKKQWGIDGFGPFTGVHWLAADATHAYVGAPLRNTVKYWGGDPATEGIWAVNLADRKIDKEIRLPPTGERQRGIVGMAAREGKMYLAVRAKMLWLKNAVKSGNVDQDHCLPRYPEKREPRRPYEVVPDPKTDFVRLFRLMGKPAGYSSRHGLTYLLSPSGPESRQHIVLAFHGPVPIGSVVYPVPQTKNYRVKLSVLKPDGPFPPDPDKREQWLDFEDSGKLAWDCVAAPPNTTTRALRITFYKGEDDIFADIDAGGGKPDAGNMAGKIKDDGLGLGGQGAWRGRLEGMKILRRRYANLAASANIRVSSGSIDARGVWDAKRAKDRPLSPTDPGIYVMQWDKPQKVRGLALKEIDGGQTEIDVFTGGPGDPVELAGQQHWEQVAAHKQKRRNHHSGTVGANPVARYLDGYIDFGAERRTRAVRLRVVEQWVDNGNKGIYGIREDRGARALDPSRCHIFGVAALQYLGGEQSANPMISERIEVVDREQGTVVEEVFLPAPGPLAIGGDGRLLALSNGKVVEVDMAGGKHRELIADLEQPRTLALDAAGNIYVYDQAPARRVIRVYDPKGAFQRQIGKPGGLRVGPWDPLRFGNVSGLAISPQGHLWLADNVRFPKRIAQLTIDGQPVKEIYGPTRYGGAGVLDPWDKRRLFLGPLEFALDWDTGKVKLKNLTTLGPHPGELPIHANGRTYMVTRFTTHGPTAQCGVVHVYEKDRLRMVAAIGLAHGFEYLKEPRVQQELGYPSLTNKRFVWCDRNGDGQVQGAEVQLQDLPRRKRGVTKFSRDLSAWMAPYHYVVSKFLPNGAPVYVEKHDPAARGALYGLDGGKVFHMGMGGDVGNAVFAPDGKRLWNYKTEGAGVHGYFKAKPYFDGQVVGHFGFVGHETTQAGDLGEVIVMHSNAGAWSIWTADGLFAGDILRNYRRGDSFRWHMPEHQRGLDLSGLSAGQEHFNGYFCRTRDDNKYYIVAGHHQASVVEVKGLEKFQRLAGPVAVDPEALASARNWGRQRARDSVYAAAPVIDCRRTENVIKIDGETADWRDIGATRFEIGEKSWASLRLAYNDKRLFLLYETRGLGPMKNTGKRWDHLFKTGAAVDFKLGADPKADPTRRAPVAGDLRLLMTINNDQPRAILYEAVVPGTPDDKAWHVTSPVGHTSFDRVTQRRDVRLAHSLVNSGYVLEASVPLKTLGIAPRDDLRLKLDWGVLAADKHGNAVERRLYWASKGAAVLADTPSEARLRPDLWGAIRFHGKKAGADPADLLKLDAPADTGDDDLLEEIEEDMK